MSILANVISAASAHDRFVEQQVRKARRDPKFSTQLRRKWKKICDSLPTIESPTGLKFPRLALPQTDEPGEIARFLFDEGLPGEFPFVTAAYPEMYVAKSETRNPKNDNKAIEEPTRLFAGLGLAEDTNRRFHYLTQHQHSIRLSTAFDGPTLYGLDSDADGAFGKIGEGGAAVDTVEDMQRLYAGFPLGDEHFSVSMTINGPAPILLAMYIAAAKRRCGAGVVAKLRGPAQA